MIIVCEKKKMDKRRAERTYFNTEYMPELEENEIESNDPMEIERLTDTRDIIKDDADRFRKLCKANKFNFNKLNKEYERKLKLAKPFQDKLYELKHQYNLALIPKYKRNKLMKEIEKLESQINKIMK